VKFSCAKKGRKNISGREDKDKDKEVIGFWGKDRKLEQRV
jgi:hypothetical protein